MQVKEAWAEQYPSAVKSWEDNWEHLVTFYAYPQELRRIISTTNAIEGLHRQFRKVTKTKAVFPHDDSLRKMLYLASLNIQKNGRSVITTGIWGGDSIMEVGSIPNCV